MKTFLLALFMNLIVIFSFAQQSSVKKKENDTKFLLTGYGYAGFEKVGTEKSTFGPAGFSPIFLWKKSDKLFFEAEGEFEIEDGNLTIGLEYAVLHYQINKHLRLNAGKFLSPFGIFFERLHPAWINKFAEKPLGFSEDNVMVGPAQEFGVSLSGGLQVGNSKINYVGYISNGPKLDIGDENPLDAGKLEYDNLGDNNNNKAVGGRIGFLPFYNSSVEIGFSGQFAKVAENESAYKNVSAQLYAADFSLIHKIDFLKSNIDLKAQCNFVNVSKAVYSDVLGTNYSFDNNSSAWFGQLAIRPEFIENKFFKNTEVSARYSAIMTPKKSEWGQEINQIAIGLNYWLAWNSVIKLNYQLEKAKGEKEENGYFIQWALGF